VGFVFLCLDVTDKQTNTRRLVHMEEDSERVYTKYPSGQRSVYLFRTWLDGTDASVDVTGEPKRFLGHLYIHHYGFRTTVNIASDSYHYIDHVQYHYSLRPALYPHVQIDKATSYISDPIPILLMPSWNPGNHLIGQPNPPAYQLPPPPVVYP
jgi:hypothetical protein